MCARAHVTQQGVYVTVTFALLSSRSLLRFPGAEEREAAAHAGSVLPERPRVTRRAAPRDIGTVEKELRRFVLLVWGCSSSSSVPAPGASPHTVTHHCPLPLRRNIDNPGVYKSTFFNLIFKWIIYIYLRM